MIFHQFWNFHVDSYVDLISVGKVILKGKYGNVLHDDMYSYQIVTISYMCEIHKHIHMYKNLWEWKLEYDIHIHI